MLSNPAAFFGAMLPIQQHNIAMFALGESYAGHFVCKWAGLRPLQPLAFYRPWMLAKENKIRRRHRQCLHLAVWIIHVCTRESYAGHFVCKWGGLRTPKLPRVLRAMAACKKKGVVASIDACKRQASRRRRVDHSCFTLGESYAGHFVCNCGGRRPHNPPAF